MISFLTFTCPCCLKIIETVPDSQEEPFRERLIVDQLDSLVVRDRRDLQPYWSVSVRAQGE